MLLHAFPSMFISSFREFPKNCVYKQGGLNYFIEYLHRKLLTETEWNKHDSSHYSKQNLSQGKILAILSTSLYDKLNYIQQITSEQQRCPDVYWRK
jgi:hypothetical protein